MKKRYCITLIMLLIVSMANAGLFDAVKKVGSGLGNALEQKVCDDGGLGGCNGTVETYKDGNYCQVHLQKRKNQQNAIRERIARQEANERRNKAEASENLARAKREYAASVRETEKAGQRWRESVKQDGVWGIVEVNGKSVEGKIVPKDTFREDKPEYIVISGFAKPAEPDWDHPRGNGGSKVYLPEKRNHREMTREEKFEGRRYNVMFEQFTTNHMVVREPADWCKLTNACHNGELIKNIGKLEDVIERYYACQWDAVAASYLFHHYKSIGQKEKLNKLFEEVPFLGKYLYESEDRVYKYPASEQCSDQVKLYRDLSSGASMGWCRQWLKHHGYVSQEYNRAEAGLNWEYDQKENEIVARIATNWIKLVFDSELDVLLEVQCSFGNEGVSVAALRQKYEKEWGNDIKVEESEEKFIVDKRFSVIPISKKEASKVLDMAMTGDPLEQLVLGAVLESSPANLQAGVNRDAEMYYKNQYVFNITGGGVNVYGTYSRFAWYAFVSSRKFNQYVDERKDAHLKDRALCPAGLIIDEKGGVEKRYPIDSEEVVSQCAQEHIAEIKKCDDKVYGVTITGLKWKEISNALRKKAHEDQQKKDNEAKKKQEEKALDF